MSSIKIYQQIFFLQWDFIKNAKTFFSFLIWQKKENSLSSTYFGELNETTRIVQFNALVNLPYFSTKKLGQKLIRRKAETFFHFWQKLIFHHKWSELEEMQTKKFMKKIKINSFKEKENANEQTNEPLHSYVVLIVSSIIM
jgi:hypothetical protein